MSLINYIEPVSVGETFIGIGALIIFVVFALILWKTFKPVIGWITLGYDRFSRLEIIESKILGRIASKKGIDLDKEMLKRNLVKKPTKNFRQRIEDQMYEEMFGKETTANPADQK